MNWKEKKVLVVGLGILGGGVATVKWLMNRGASVTVTDLCAKEELENSLKKLGIIKIPAKQSGVMTCHNTRGEAISFVLGKHRAEDFKTNDVIVVNPAVKIIGNKFLVAARKAKKPIINDLLIFLKEIKNPIIAITGTRGKTTTANWIAHFLKAKFPRAKAGGNSSDEALLKLLPKLGSDKKHPVVLELSSFQLELMEDQGNPKQLDNSSELSSWGRAPHVAVITNLYRDHLNRHETMENYAFAKANVFKSQAESQKLILNCDNKWTKFFLKMQPRARVYFISIKKSPPINYPALSLIRANKRYKGIVFDGGGVKKEKILFPSELAERFGLLGEHNMYNFLMAALAAHLAGISWREICRLAMFLPKIKFRQEEILKSRGLTVINDTTATSPEGGIAAVKRFAGSRTVLITGGTDKELNYKEWAKCVKKYIVPGDLFLLEGSATKKMIRELKKIGYFEDVKPRVFENLELILRAVKTLLKAKSYKLKAVVLFSPSAASFEKFKNEFDRGEKFNELAKKYFGK